MTLLFWALAGAWGANVEHGERLAGLAGCAACHTASAGEPFAGGHAIRTRFGTFYGSNITPSVAGLKGWSRDDFEKALRKGRSPHGGVYWPAFPYTSFGGMNDSDLDDLWAFLGTVPPSERANQPHEGTRSNVATAPVANLRVPVPFNSSTGRSGA